MSTRRPDWWPMWMETYPVTCPIRGGMCIRYNCNTGILNHCDERANLALVPKDVSDEYGVNTQREGG